MFCRLSLSMRGVTGGPAEHAGGAQVFFFFSDYSRTGPPRRDRNKERWQWGINLRARSEKRVQFALGGLIKNFSRIASRTDRVAIFSVNCSQARRAHAGSSTHPFDSAIQMDWPPGRPSIIVTHVPF